MKGITRRTFSCDSLFHFGNALLMCLRHCQITFSIERARALTYTNARFFCDRAYIWYALISRKWCWNISAVMPSFGGNVAERI